MDLDPDAYVAPLFDHQKSVEGRLVSLTSFDYGWESWSFSIQQFWYDVTDGTVYTAFDSGCSCPSPFEFTQVRDLEKIESMQDFYDLRPEEGFPEPFLEDGYQAARKTVEDHMRRWRK